MWMTGRARELEKDILILGLGDGGGDGTTTYIMGLY